jgi:CBS domain-containing protein
VLVGLGMWGFLWTAAFGALWLALIGWFLVMAATEEGRQARLRELLGGVAVRETMTPDPVTVPPDLTIDRFLSDRAYAYRHSAFPVAGAEGRVLGLFTVDRARGVPEQDHRRTTVGEAMLPLEEVRVAAPGDALADLLPRMEPGGENRVLVMEGERLVGIISPSDLSRTVRWLTAHRGPGKSGK